MRKKIITILKFILSFFIFFESADIQRLLATILGFKKIGVAQATLLSFLSNIIILLCLFLLFRKEIIKEFKIFKKNLSDDIDIGFKYWLIGLACMMVSNILIGLLFKSSGAANEEAVQKMIHAAPMFMIINAGILAPINEELLFRKNFRNILTNNFFFIIISGLFFGYLHVSDATTLEQFLYIIPYSSLGICFAIMYSKTKTVFTSISMHAIHNTILSILSIII